MLVLCEIGPSPQSSPRRGEEAEAASQRCFIEALSPQCSLQQGDFPRVARRGEEAEVASQRSLIEAALASILSHKSERRQTREARDLIAAGAGACVFD